MVVGGSSSSAPSCPKHVTGMYSTFFFSLPFLTPPLYMTPQTCNGFSRTCCSDWRDGCRARKARRLLPPPLLFSIFPLYFVHSQGRFWDIFGSIKKKRKKKDNVPLFICGKEKNSRSSFLKASESELKPRTTPVPTPADMTHSRLT